jgi:mannose-1-phosphate guanylyltransferase/mannose-6-phosphate isomerase
MNQEIGSHPCDRFQVKRFTVHPGEQLSRPRHRDRAEHLTVVSDTAEVVLGDGTCGVHEDEAVFVPVGAHHRLVNFGHMPLGLIEVQVASDVGEDDIERIDDMYRRS